MHRPIGFRRTVHPFGVRFAPDAAAIRDLGGVVGGPDFVVKQLAAHVADQRRELAGVGQQGARRLQLANPLRQGQQ